MFRKKNKPQVETDEQIISNMERLNAMQDKGFNIHIRLAIEAMAKRLERRNRNLQ